MHFIQDAPGTVEWRHTSGRRDAKTKIPTLKNPNPSLPEMPLPLPQTNGERKNQGRSITSRSSFLPSQTIFGRIVRKKKKEYIRIAFGQYDIISFYLMDIVWDWGKRGGFVGGAQFGIVCGVESRAPFRVERSQTEITWEGETMIRRRLVFRLLATSTPPPASPLPPPLSCLLCKVASLSPFRKSINFCSSPPLSGYVPSEPRSTHCIVLVFIVIV